MNDENLEYIDDEPSATQYSRRKPYIEMEIDRITVQGKYRVMGSIVSVSDEAIEVADDTASLNVELTPNTVSPNLQDGMQVRILGYIEFEPEKKMKATIIQDLTKVDLDLYRQMRELELSLKK